MRLPAGMISISIPSASISVCNLLSPERGGRRAALGHQTQPSCPAGEQPSDQLVEIAGGGGERALEAILDLAVCVADQLLELAQGRLEVLALALELVDVRHGFGVLVRRERVDGAKLRPPAGQPLEPSAESLPFSVSERFEPRLG